MNDIAIELIREYAKKGEVAEALLGLTTLFYGHETRLDILTNAVTALESPAAPQVAGGVEPALCLTDIMRKIREVRGFTSERRNEAALATTIHSVNSGITWDHLVALCDAYRVEQATNVRTAGHIDSLQQQLDSAREAERGTKEKLEEVHRTHAAEFAYRCGDLQRDLEEARNAHAALMAATTPREEELRALRTELERAKEEARCYESRWVEADETLTALGQPISVGPLPDRIRALVVAALKAPTPAAPGVNEEGLLPCPFCGATDGIEKFDHGHGRFQYYVCGGCDAYGPEGNTPEGAKSTWNRRALSLPAAPSATCDCKRAGNHTGDEVDRNMCDGCDLPLVAPIRESPAPADEESER